MRLRNNLERKDLIDLWLLVSSRMLMSPEDKDVLYDILDDWFNERV